VNKTKLQKSIPESFVPLARCLFQAINTFLQFTNIVRRGSISEARRLMHKHCFFKIAMKKSIIYVKLPKGPTIHDSNGED
jgi:hypothetical protein